MLFSSKKSIYPVWIRGVLLGQQLFGHGGAALREYGVIYNQRCNQQLQIFINQYFSFFFEKAPLL